MFALLQYSTSTLSTTSVYLFPTCSISIECILVYMLLGPAVRSEVYAVFEPFTAHYQGDLMVDTQLLCVILK